MKRIGIQSKIIFKFVIIFKAAFNITWKYQISVKYTVIITVLVSKINTDNFLDHSLCKMFCNFKFPIHFDAYKSYLKCNWKLKIAKTTRSSNRALKCLSFYAVRFFTTKTFLCCQCVQLTRIKTLCFSLFFKQFSFHCVMEKYSC